MVLVPSRWSEGLSVPDSITGQLQQELAGAWPGSPQPMDVAGGEGPQHPRSRCSSPCILEAHRRCSVSAPVTHSLLLLTLNSAFIRLSHHEPARHRFIPSSPQFMPPCMSSFTNIL